MSDTTGAAGATGAEDVAASTTVLVRFFASARAAAGVDEQRLTLPAGGSVADVVTLLRECHSDGLARVLDVASFLLDGVAVRDTGTRLPGGAELDVLPPFAGG